jgi:hypothetical protein
MYFTIGTNKKLLGDYIYLQGYSSNSYTVKIFSTSQKKIINSFTLDMIPYSIAYDDKYIYVTNFLSAGCVSILDRQFIENSYMIRCLSGGNSYLGTDGKSSLTNKSLGGWPTNNEWDKYIVKSDLNGKITPGDNNIWHYNHIWSNTQNSSINGTWVNPLGVTYNRDSSLKIIRGNMNGQLNADWKDIGHSSIEYAATTSGFRPVLQYLEPDSKQTNSWY